MATARRLSKKMMAYRFDKGVFGTIVESKPDLSEFKYGDPVFLTDRAAYGLMFNLSCSSLSLLKRAIVTKFKVFDPFYTEKDWVQVEFLYWFTMHNILVKKNDLIKLIK